MKVAVIGAGIGGLAVAVRLANRGHNITLFEKNSFPGGRLSEIKAEGFRFDTGASVFTMPELVEKLFADSKVGIEVFLKYSRMDVNCRYFLPGGKVVRMYADPRKLREELRKNSPEPFENIERRLIRSAELFRLSQDCFIDFEGIVKKSSLFSYDYNKIRLKSFKYLKGGSVHKINENSFIDKDIANIFDTFGIYNGYDPYKTNPLLALGSYPLYGTNRYFIQGGFYALADALMRLAKERRVGFRFGNEVEQICINNGKADGVVIKGGEQMGFDAVVSALDINYAGKKLFCDPELPKYQGKELTSSALVFLWGVKRTTPRLDCYNVILSSDPEKEFDLIFDRKIISSDPTISIYISSKLCKTDAPPGCENWQVHINAPVNMGQDWTTQINQSRIIILKRIYEKLGVDIKKDLVYEKIISPVNFEHDYRTFRGSLHGYMNNHLLSPVSGYPNRHPSIKNLYFAGGTVHPGGSVPMTLMSAFIVDSIFEKEHPVTITEPTLF